MERRKEEAIGTVIRRFLRIAGLETPLGEHRVMELWPQVVGDVIMRYTSGLEIYNRKLYVRLSSAVLRSQLSLQRATLVQELNKRAEGNWIEDIIFT